jgi:hypothetical protein
MWRALAWALAIVVAGPGAGRADTLRDVLQAHGVAPPARLPDLDAPLGASAVVAGAGATVVVYDASRDRGGARLVALRVESGTGAAHRVPLAWPPGAPEGLGPETCRGLDSAARHGSTVLVTAHVNPSAACTLVLDRALVLRAVLAGWPMAALPDGRVVYQRNQIHFQAVHPLGLGLFDPARLADTPLYPQRPDSPTRAAHVARMRQAYTEEWCRPRNHPCDPAVFDERMASDVAVGGQGDALAFVVAFDNAAAWSDAERWGRLEPFRELRRALARWDGQGEPPPALASGLVAGLARARNLHAGPHVAAALAGDPELRDLVGHVLASPGSAAIASARWLVALDPRWGDAATWLRLARLVEVPDELTEVVCVYAGLRHPGPIAYRELARREFEARFGPGAPGRALEPAVLRQLFGTRPP